MSALFMLSVLMATGRSGHLTTIEGGRDQFELASNMLRARYGEQVSCHFGPSSEVLADLAKSSEGIDFLFHDAGHSREMYLKDLGAAQPLLKPRSIILIDDIYWNDARFYKVPPRAQRVSKKWCKFEPFSTALLYLVFPFFASSIDASLM